MDMLEAPRSVHGSALPIPALDFANGQQVVADSEATSMPIPVRTAYLITATVPVLVRQGGDAGAGIPGSVYIAAGVPLHLLLDAGHLSVVAVGADTGDVYVVPLR